MSISLSSSFSSLFGLLSVPSLVLSAPFPCLPHPSLPSFTIQLLTGHICRLIYQSCWLLHTHRVVKTFISDVQSESTTTSIKLLTLVSIGKIGRLIGGWGLVGGAMWDGACRLGMWHGLLFCLRVLTCTVFSSEVWTCCLWVAEYQAPLSVFTGICSHCFHR